MAATHRFAPKRGTPSGIRTRDLHLERVTSWAARLWGRRREDTVTLTAVSMRVLGINAQLEMIRDRALGSTTTPLTDESCQVAVTSRSSLLKFRAPASTNPLSEWFLDRHQLTSVDLNMKAKCVLSGRN